MFFSNVIFLLLLNDLFLLAAPGVTWLIRLTAFQGVLLGSLLFDMDHALLGGAVLGIKGILLPVLLARTYKHILWIGNGISNPQYRDFACKGAHEIAPRRIYSAVKGQFQVSMTGGRREKTRHLNHAIAVLMGVLGLVFSLWLENRMYLMPGLFPDLLFPAAITTLFCGLVLVIGRATALSQVIGYLVAENGIFLLGAPLMAAGAIWFELALLLDIFVAVFVMGIAIGHIGEKFESMDTARFRSLRD